MRLEPGSFLSPSSSLRPSIAYISILAVIASVIAALLLETTSLRADSASNPPLPNGKLISVPAMDDASGVGSLPMNVILTPDSKYAVVSDMGYRQRLTAIDTATGVQASHLEFARSRGSQNHGLYYGMAATGDKIYAGEGASSAIGVYQIDGKGVLTETDSIPAQAGDFVAGIAVDGRGYLYAVNNEFGARGRGEDSRDLTTSGSLAIYSLSAKAQVGRVSFPTIEIDSTQGKIAPTNYPLTVAAFSDGSKVFVGSQRDSQVIVVDASNTAAPAVTGHIDTGAHPDAMILSADQKTLYVANAGSDTVSIVDTKTYAMRRTISVRPPAAAKIPGATPTGLALSPDGHTLYAALGDMNAVAVIDLASGKVAGYIPAGWYPSGVVATGASLLVINAKGSNPRNPNDRAAGPNGAWGTRILNIIEGTYSWIPLPASKELAADTKQVYENNRLAAIASAADKTLRRIGLSSGKITHVIYIVKENRTYDQVLGDMPQGNGDPHLTLFGKDVTPNLHRLAERFVLLDNFFDSGEVSGDGWDWSTQSFANEAVVKDVPYNYSGRGRQYDFEGQNNGYLTGGFPAKDPYGNPLSTTFPNGAPQIPDVSESPSGHIWDLVKAAHLKYRNYGFFYSFGVAGLLPDNYPTAAGVLPAGHDLDGVSDIDFRRFDTSFPDSNAPSIYFKTKGDRNALYSETEYGHYKMPSRYAEWEREFDKMIAADPSGRSVPAFMTVRFMLDHTAGASSDNHTPRSDVADNDCAVGELVEHISRSPIWKHTAIFVIEDDAQDGQDHVDAHRSICFVASPYIKKGAVDHGFYNTDSVLHTMEAILGLPPMSQYDAVASPFADFTATPDNADIYESVLPAEAIIDEHNEDAKKLKDGDPRKAIIVASDKMDFVHPDSAPSDELNKIIWKTVKGVDSEPPASKSVAIVGPSTAQHATRPDTDDD